MVPTKKELGGSTTMTATATEPTAESLQAHIEALQAELAALPKQITAAAATGDDATYTRLAGRRAVLPGQIRTLERELQAVDLRARIAEHEAGLQRTLACLRDVRRGAARDHVAPGQSE